MNYKKIRNTLCAAIIGVSCFTAIPAAAVQTTGNASAEIRQLIVAIQSRALSMGVLSSSAIAGTVTLDTSGAVSAAGGVEIAGGAPTAGGFDVIGTPDANVTISFNNGTLIGVGLPMTLSNLVHNAGVTPKFDNSGFLSFDVGAELAVNAGQLQGVYAGTYEVSINYP